MATIWSVYLVRCRDGSLYTGITTDLVRRLAAHNSGTASRYTRSRRPVRVVHEETGFNHSTALKREAAIKRLPRQKKLALLAERPGPPKAKHTTLRKATRPRRGHPPHTP